MTAVLRLLGILTQKQVKHLMSMHIRINTYTHCVCTQESSQTPFAILDGEISTVRIVCTRLGAVIFVVDGYNKNHNYLNTQHICIQNVIQFYCLPQALSVGSHLTEGTQRLDEPVSNTTVKGCGGVPMVMSP